MLEILKEIILNFHAQKLDCGVPRQIDISTVNGKATVCIGVRRSGKSTLMLQIIERLLKKGVLKENILYLNFFDDFDGKHKNLTGLTHKYLILKIVVPFDGK